MVRFATIGTSKITTWLLEAAAFCKDFHLEAVYSRSKEKGTAFASKYGASKVYTSLEKLANDPDIDAVYIASPNSAHAEQAIGLLNAGKHVLCEKSMGANQKQVQAMFEAAEKNHVLLMEAVRPLHDPGYHEICRNLPKLGQIRRAHFQYSQYSSRYDSFLLGEHHNIFDINCAAGALMDIGVYCVQPFLDLFGIPKKVHASSVLLRGGIDGIGTILAEYDDMIGEILYSKITASNIPSEIQGEKGTMKFNTISTPHEISITYNDGTEEHLEVDYLPTNNMIYELEDFIHAIEQNHNLDRYKYISIESSKLMDEVRKQCNIIFPTDHSDN